MTTIDLRELEGDQVVIHFGGELRSVDAYTFANSLIAFSDAAAAVNAVVNPGQNVELRLEANGPGSYRALVKRRAKGPIIGFFSRGAENLLWTAVGLAVLGPFFSSPETTVTINTDEVIIERGGDRLIVPRTVYDQSKSVETDPEVRRQIRRTFEILEKDEAITNFGLAKSLKDDHPVVHIPRSDFGRAAEGPEIEDDQEKRRAQKSQERLVILKAWFTKGTQKWQFEWNGFPISAPIKDDDFWMKVESHEVVFGNGDALDVVLEYEQEYGAGLELWSNDLASFKVTKVIRPVSRSGRQGTLGV